MPYARFSGEKTQQQERNYRGTKACLAMNQCASTLQSSQRDNKIIADRHQRNTKDKLRIARQDRNLIFVIR